MTSKGAVSTDTLNHQVEGKAVSTAKRNPDATADIESINQKTDKDILENRSPKTVTAGLTDNCLPTSTIKRPVPMSLLEKLNHMKLNRSSRHITPSSSAASVDVDCEMPKPTLRRPKNIKNVKYITPVLVRTE